MSSQRSAPALEVRLRPSRRLGTALLSAHAGAAAMLPALYPALGLHVLWLGSAIIANAVWCFRKHVALTAAGAIVAVRYSGMEGWLLETVRAVSIEATLLPDSFVHHGLTVLNFRCADRRRRSVVVLPDAVDADAFRRLRAMLLTGRVTR